MWLTAVYHQVSMFSLKPANATSTGGRSLLVPTPFSIKMALLDVALRSFGEDKGTFVFPLIRDLVVALSPPIQIVVNNCFMRIHKPRRRKSGAENKEDTEGDEGENSGGGPFIRSVAFREYVQYNGPLGIALEVRTVADADVLAQLLMQVTYFGKRGSLFQIDSPPAIAERLPVRQGYIPINRPLDAEFRQSQGVLQVLDDCAAHVSFTKVSIYSEESLLAGKDRISQSVALPYRLARSSRGFSLYQRIGASQP